MNRTSLTVLLAMSMAASVGCASKNYVRQETTPLINKTNELDDLTAKNSKDIKDVDTRAQAGIQQVQAKTAEVDQKAQAAGQQADQAQTQANNAVHRVDSLQNTVANLDNYRVVTETSVHFAFNKDNLTADAKAALDQLVTDVSNTKGYILTVEGATDSTGDSEYNYGLSQRRADAVIQYLARRAQHSGAQDLLNRSGQGQAGRFEQDPRRPGQESPRRCAAHDEHDRTAPASATNRRPGRPCKQLSLLPGGLRQHRPLHPPEWPDFLWKSKGWLKHFSPRFSPPKRDKIRLCGCGVPFCFSR